MASTEIFVNFSRFLRDKTSDAVSDPLCPIDLKIDLENITKSDTITFALVRQLHAFLSKQDDGAIFLHELLAGSDVVLPEVKPLARNPELESRCNRLKTQQSNMAYRRMVEDIDSTEQMDRTRMKDFGKEMKEVNKQLVSVFNFLVTVGGAFAFGYKASEYSMEVPNMAIQMCSGLVLGTLVFFADLYFLLMYNIE